MKKQEINKRRYMAVEEKGKVKKVIIVNNIQPLTCLVNSEILEFLQCNLQIIQLTEKVERYLLLRFQLENDSQLFSLLKPRLLIIQREEDKADFITEYSILTKDLFYCQYEVDDLEISDINFSFK